MKVNCYKCKWRESLAGSTHSCCKHPSLKRVADDSFLEMSAMFASVGRVFPFLINNKELNIKANSNAIKKGWFNFPFNFDPIWLDNCDGFENIDK